MNNDTKFVGVGFSGLLGIVFIVLKLAGVVDWRWVWVLAPLWVPVAFVAAIIVCWLIAAIIKVVRRGGK